MNYNLNDIERSQKNGSFFRAFRRFLPLLGEEKVGIAASIAAIIANSILNLVAPLYIAHTIDTYFITQDFNGVLKNGAILLVIYICAFFANFIQTRVMGGVAQRVLFSLRNRVFKKLQDLPVAFFNANKAGDLISRINNDTDKLNQFFSRGLMQFLGNVIMIIGSGISMVAIDWKLGLAALAPAAALFIVTRVLSGWVKKQNKNSLNALGGMSGSIQESLNNFKVVVAFNRRDYFRDRFKAVNERNFFASIFAGIANTIFIPIYGLSSNLAILIVIAYGTHLISVQVFTIGLLISFISYVNRFYDPLRQIASLWTALQLALAAWDRISAILFLESDLKNDPVESVETSEHLLEFQNVNFQYADGKEVLRDVNFTLDRGKTYALVGPTGGGKTTTASLMARLYDPTSGMVRLGGRDMRFIDAADRTKRIGFILQEPFLFTGTIKENILYGNDEYAGLDNDAVTQLLDSARLDVLLARFDEGLDTKVSADGESISLGQKQLIAFMRAVLRKPELLILDEATANIDTVTEQQLQAILENLPKETTRVIIAHRLNTIENADEIFFVNSGTITQAGSLDHALHMLLDEKRVS